MQLLLVHSHGFDWKVTDKAIGEPESSKNVKMEYSTSDSTLVVFISVETNDIPDISNVTTEAIDEIISALKDIGESNLILYPWVHLAKTQPAKPDAALRTLKGIESSLRSDNSDLNIVRAPFGYYKSFNLNCKGHALAERSKEIVGQSGLKSLEKPAEVTKAITAEQTARSTFHILSVDGKIEPFDTYNFEGQKELELFVKYETAKDRTVSTPPLHVDVMKNLELVDYEDGTDPGNCRILPR
jgi:threonyl-tRNA synthetase